MAETFSELDERLSGFIAEQHVFFVATAPASPDGLVNVSPKGLDTLRILDPVTVAYLDLTGSGIETAAHVRENGRICLMFCAFEGPPRVLRLHGRGEILESGDPGFAELYPLFPPRESARAIVRVHVTRISTSCGYGVPLLDYRGDRETLELLWRRRAGDILDYRRDRNAVSVDGLPGLERKPAWPPGAGPAAAGR